MSFSDLVEHLQPFSVISKSFPVYSFFTKARFLDFVLRPVSLYVGDGVCKTENFFEPIKFSNPAVCALVYSNVERKTERLIFYISILCTITVSFISNSRGRLNNITKHLIYQCFVNKSIFNRSSCVTVKQTNRHINRIGFRSLEGGKHPEFRKRLGFILVIHFPPYLSRLVR